jgi:hypothetical protein
MAGSGGWGSGMRVYGISEILGEYYYRYTRMGEEKDRKPPRVLECTHTWRGLHRHSRIMCACTWAAGQAIRSADVTDHILAMGPWMVGRTTDMVMVMISLHCEQCRREGVGRVREAA